MSGKIISRHRQHCRVDCDDLRLAFGTPTQMRDLTAELLSRLSVAICSIEPCARRDEAIALIGQLRRALARIEAQSAATGNTDAARRARAGIAPNNRQDR